MFDKKIAEDAYKIYSHLNQPTFPETGIALNGKYMTTIDKNIIYLSGNSKGKLVIYFVSNKYFQNNSPSDINLIKDESLFFKKIKNLFNQTPKIEVCYNKDKLCGVKLTFSIHTPKSLITGLKNYLEIKDLRNPTNDDEINLMRFSRWANQWENTQAKAHNTPETIGYI